MKYTAAMRINPRVRCVMGPMLYDCTYVYPGLEVIQDKEILLDVGGKRWWPAHHTGRCYAKTTIVVGFCGGSAPIKTLYHELFHSIYDMFNEDELEILEEHGEKIRQANRQAEIHMQFPSFWIEDEEEAEALAFDHWTAGMRLPHGIEAGRDVVNIWERVLAGRCAK